VRKLALAAAVSLTALSTANPTRSLAAVAPAAAMPQAAAIAAVPHGRATAKSADNTSIWKTITLGQLEDAVAVRAALASAHVRVGNSAGNIVGQPAFTFTQRRKQLDLVVLTAAELGFDAPAASLADIYARAAELGFELCPAEAAVQLRLEYRNQRVGEFLSVAMDPIADARGQPVSLSVANGGAGLLLFGGEGRADLAVPTSVRLVFVRPRLHGVTLSNQQG
jgi:hypothetical protein